MMAKPWSEHRGTITKLYIHEGRTLEDVRNIMKVQHNFEASIRSYRQHFDKWEIGKYNCKKRERRRRQSLTNNMLSPPHSPPDMAIKREEMGSPASSSSSMSRHSSEQKPLPILKQPHILYPTYLQQIRPQDDLPAKAENSRESFAGGLDMFRNTQVAQDMFSSTTQTLAGKSLEEHPQATLAVLQRRFIGHRFRIRYRAVCLSHCCTLAVVNSAQDCELQTYLWEETMGVQAT
ncbi:Clr5 domain-containing protein [Fusarium avenaceum]|nr:Clr5 domain-containing protein [Fusarium avenaceum]